MRRISLRTLFSWICSTVFILLLIFTFSNWNENSHEADLSSVKCDCPTVPNLQTEKLQSITEREVLTSKTEKTEPSSTTTTTAPTTTRPFPECHQVSNESAVQRAIIIYYPHHQIEYFLPELRWLFRSWVEMLKSQPKHWRTDLLVFTYNFSSDFRSLGCVNKIRQNKEEPSICRVFIYLPIQFRIANLTNNDFEHAFDDAKALAKVFNDSIENLVTIPIRNDTKWFDAKRSELLYKELQTYGYIDSINVMYEGLPTFQMYDFILRTDMDVFIYRHFGWYIPQNCSFLTGGGGYGTDFNRRKLRRIARDIGYSHAGISGMGSTWYGSVHDGYLVANYTLEGMLWLHQYEFASPERESKLGTMLWPEWHYGVLLLYGQHLALNHLVAENMIRIVIATDQLDQSTTDKNANYIKNGVRLNLHCWHTDERFSKFAFKMGHYNQTELELYRNDTTARDYAMRMALESKQMTLEEMAELIPK